jgi:chorismate dehydratase
MTAPVSRVGMPPDIGCQPLLHALRRHGGFALTAGSAAEIALRLRSGTLDASFVTPLEYARDGTDYVIIPGVALSSHLPSAAVTLHFREGLHTLSTIAVDPGAGSDIVLAMILLTEQFDLRPSVVPVAGDLDAMLRRADAALLSGNASLRQSGGHGNRLDLVEHWIDLTGLPYVHGFWCTRPGVLTPARLAAFEESASEAAAAADALTPATLDAGLPALHEDDLQAVINAWAFAFNDSEQQAVTRFLEYAYFHGMLPDVPDLRFAGAEDEPPAPVR